MNQNAVICAIEHVLRKDGCNEIIVGELFQRVRLTRGNHQLSEADFISILNQLIADALFESFDVGILTLETLIARSQNHPSVPIGNSIIL
jgi:hypothetical protein